MEVVHKGKVAILENDVKMWKKEWEAKDMQLGRMKGFVHPMVCEDLEGEIGRVREKLEVIEGKFKEARKKAIEIEQTKMKM